MKKLFKFLGFVVTWLFPFAIVYLNHIAFAEGGREADLFGILMLIAIVIGLIKWVENKITVWEIQDKHAIFILNWKSAKRMIMVGLLTWVLFTVEDSLMKMQVTAMLITVCFMVGWVLSLLGSLPKKIKKET